MLKSFRKIFFCRYNVHRMEYVNDISERQYLIKCKDCGIEVKKNIPPRIDNSELDSLLRAVIQTYKQEK